MAVCSISQPVYLPWIGYFNLILSSDHFVFLDDAQFSKNTYGNRNRIPSKNGPVWLTIPIKHGPLQRTFLDCHFDETQGWRKKQLKTIQLIYSKAPFFIPVFQILQKKILDENLKNLASLSSEITIALSEYLGLKTKFHFSSQLEIEGKRSEKIFEICKKLDCDTYLSAAGAQEYIEDDGVLPSSDLHLKFVNIVHKEYPQVSSQEFVSHMSIIDLLMNLSAQQAFDYIRQSNVKDLK